MSALRFLRAVHSASLPLALPHTPSPRRDASLGELDALMRTQAVAVPTPAEPVEVDGFRVGDLVRWSGLMGDAAAMTGGNRWSPISGFSGTKAYYEGGVRNGSPVANLTRKPVEVGDTVRVSQGPATGYTGIVGAKADVDGAFRIGDTWVHRDHVVAVASKGAP